MLPRDFRESIIWKSGEFTSYFELRTHVMTKLREIRKARGQSTHHVLEEIANSEEVMALEDSGEMVAIAHMLADGGCQPGEIMALAKKFYNRRGPQQPRNGQRFNSQPARPTGTSRDERPREDRRCVNCNEKGHSAADCKKPKVDFKDRKCFECGKPGHTANRCPEARRNDGKRSNVNAMDGDDANHYTFCLEDADGFAPVRRGVKPRPMPTSTTMGDILNKAFGKYTALQNDAEEEKQDVKCAFDNDDRNTKRAPRKGLRARFCTEGYMSKLPELNLDLGSQGNMHDSCSDTCCARPQRQGAVQPRRETTTDTRGGSQDREEPAAEMPPICGTEPSTVSRGSQERLELAAEMPPIACVTPVSLPNPHATAAGHPNAFGPESGAGWFLPTDEPTKAKLSGGDNYDDYDSTTPPLEILMPLELDDEAIMVAGEEEIFMVVAYDTAAVDNVCSRDDLPGHSVMPSNGSRRGQGYVAANGTRISNEGEINIVMEPEGTKNAVGTIFQIADVSRPLLSASKVADAGYEAHVNALVATISKNGKTVAKFHRKGGLYLATMRIRRPKDPSSADSAPAGFPGQGAKQ
jgi:hypothetical protein